MSAFPYKIDALGRREVTSLATATTQRIFASLGSAEPSRRKAVSVNNPDAAADLFVSLVASGSGTPTVSATDCDAVIPPKATRQFLVGPGIELWVRSSSAASVSYTALELL